MNDEDLSAVLSALPYELSAYVVALARQVEMLERRLCEIEAAFGVLGP
jgi:hypothetical protein